MTTYMKSMTGTVAGDRSMAAADAPAANAGAASPVTRSREIYEDARGHTYRAVRFCDLDRICDK